MTMALTALGRPDARTKALVDVVAELVRTDDGRRHVAAEQSGLGVRYDPGEAVKWYERAKRKVQEFAALAARAARIANLAVREEIQK